MSLILFAAPSEALKERAEKIIMDKKLDIPVIVTHDGKTAEDIRCFPESMVLISRGGIAEELKRLPEKTVVEVNASFNDILSAIEKLIDTGCKKIAVVMRENILHNAARDFRLSGVKIFVRPCRSYAEIETMIRGLVIEQKIDGIAGCNYAVHYAEKINMPNAYVDSGDKSLLKAVDEALTILGTKKLQALQLERLNAVIHNIQEGIVVLDEKRQPIFFNNLAEQVFGNRTLHDWEDKMKIHLKNYNGEAIIDVNNNKILFHVVPLKISNQIENEVVVFQEVRNIEKSEQKIRFSMYQKGLYAKHNFSDILTCSDRMKKIILLAGKFAKTEANVLVYGETGTGKEGMAQSIHNASLRAAQPFVSVNCASIPVNLIESELFGYVEGAFTGARKSGKKGLFELAHKGTIFLDEIGELPLDIQSRLLRVLQEHEIMRVGDDKILPLDIRVICATNKNLKKMVDEGRFREDLYYRINVLRIPLPPLRDRPEDILMLMKAYFERFAENMNWEDVFTHKAEKFLCEYDWPGNIRELRNIAEVFACYGDEKIDENKVEEFLDYGTETSCHEVQTATIQLPLDLSMKEAEREIIRQMLLEYSPEEVCSRLGISRVTLWRKCKK
jgi:transcriptional regulator with PAS, ATPase and Fis domain